MNASLRNDIVEWDVLNWSRALNIWQPIIDQLPKQAKILAIGERRGGLSLWLALQGFHVICTDRLTPKDEASELHNRYHVADKVTYEPLDITITPEDMRQYDVIIMKSVLGGIKAEYGNASTRNVAIQQKAIVNIIKMLKPGGYLLTADNMKGSKWLQLLRKRSEKQKGWYYFSIAELKHLLSPFPEYTVQTFGLVPGKFSLGLLNSFTFFINRHLSKWLPTDTKYIGISIARKGF